MTDVLLHQTPDNGEIDINGGAVAMTDGLETALYLSLFGGNVDDAGGQDLANTWWGNRSEQDPAQRYRSETQHLLGTLPATSGNLRRIQDAAQRDLQWLESVDLAVTAALVALNTVEITIVSQGSRYVYQTSWGSSTQ
jgi:phage gp46-like protein